MEGFIPEILESPKYSITKEGLKPKLYSGNIANHPDANNSMTDWFKVISYLTPNNNQKFLNRLKKLSLAVTGATIGGAAAVTDNKK